MKKKLIIHKESLEKIKKEIDSKLDTYVTYSDNKKRLNCFSEYIPKQY